MTYTSSNNPKIKLIRALRQRKERESSGLFAIEGIRPVGEAVEAMEAGLGYVALEFLCYAPDLLTSDYALSLVEREKSRGLPCCAVTAEIFASFADKENPQGILAVARWNQTSLSGLAPQNFPWGVGLVSPQDPGNIGTILRTLDAVGGDALFQLDGGVDPLVVSTPNYLHAAQTIAALEHPHILPIYEFGDYDNQLYIVMRYLLSLATAGHQGWSANLFTTVSDMFPPRAVASVVGLGGMAGSIGGMFVATAAGFILDATGSYWSLFLIAGTAYLLALAVIHLLAPRLELTRV